MEISRKKLQALMVRRELGTKALANKAGIKDTTVSQILRYESCRTETASKLCKALECEPEDIMPD